MVSSGSLKLNLEMNFVLILYLKWRILTTPSGSLTNLYQIREGEAIKPKESDKRECRKFNDV